VIDAAIDNGVPRVLALSTDKAVNPVNLYGATKLCAEKLFVHGNAYAGGKQHFSCVRYGNVVGSRGSVIPVFFDQRRSGCITVTDPRMTRFWITLDQGVRFVIQAVERMRGGEVFVPKIPSMNIMDLVAAVAPGCKVNVVGIRPGEKLHELLIGEDESRHTVDVDGMFIVQASDAAAHTGAWDHGTRLPDGYRYSSETNTQWLKAEDLRALVEGVE
jgi:UDP-N-acetylglucosamine 4,6-dehydratase